MSGPCCRPGLGGGSAEFAGLSDRGKQLPALLRDWRAATASHPMTRNEIDGAAALIDRVAEDRGSAVLARNAIATKAGE